MKKKFLLLTVIVALMFTLSFSVVSTAYASELNEVYTYQDESAVSVFTLKDETSYVCNTTNTETGDTIDLTGTYVKQGNRIIFYLAGEVLLEAEVGEDNALTMIDSETPEEPILPDTELDELKGIEAYTAQIVEWIIAGVLGLLGTSAVAVAFRGHLKSLIKSVSTALGLLKTNKDTAEEDIKNIKKEADNTLASLKTIKEEMLEINKKEFEALNRQNKLLRQVILYMAGGMKELVANGTSETVCNLLQEPDKEVKENASEEIQ